MRNGEFYSMVKNAKEIKEIYESYFHHNYNEDQKIRRIKNIIYSIEIIEWKKDALWQYLNNEMTYEEMLEYLKIEEKDL